MVTEEEWTGEVARTNRLRWVSLFGGLLVVGLIFVPCIMAGEALTSGFAADLVAAGLMLLILGPMSAGLIVLARSAGKDRRQGAGAERRVERGDRQRRPQA